MSIPDKKAIMVIASKRGDRGTGLSVPWLVLLLCVLVSGVLHAGVPTDQVRSTIDRVLEILNNPKLATQAAKEERRSRLRQVIYPRFDFAEMAQRSLGPTWRRISRRTARVCATIHRAFGRVLCQQHRVL